MVDELTKQNEITKINKRWYNVYYVDKPYNFTTLDGTVHKGPCEFTASPQMYFPSKDVAETKGLEYEKLIHDFYKKNGVWQSGCFAFLRSEQEA